MSGDLMRSKIVCFMIAVFTAGWVWISPAEGQENANVHIIYGDEFFKRGNFETARRIYESALEEDKKSFLARVRLGYISVLSNSLREAETYLFEACEMKPEESFPAFLLAEVYYRQGEMVKSAAVHRSLKRMDLARKLESFQGLEPYFFSSGPSETVVPLITKDPLPVVKVRLNGGEDVNFIIDTGSSELIVNRSLASSLGIPVFESFPEEGDEKPPYDHGRLARFSIGDWTVDNIPVLIMDTDSFSSLAGGRKVDGVIGTIFLYHYLATLDYPGNRLVLRKTTKENIDKLNEGPSEGTERFEIPFWLAGDHFILARGTVNDSDTTLFFVDTGLAGGGFACPPSMIREADIDLSDPEDAGRTGSGKRYVKVRVDKVTLGEAVQKNVICLYDVFPSSLENMFGFRVGGLVAHEFFLPYAVTFDFAGMRIIMEQPGTGPVLK